MAREFAKEFYGSKLWHDTRKLVLMRDGFLCTRCGMLAEEVHHKIFLNPSNINDLSVSVNPDNLISLCHNCHTQLHAEAEQTSHVLPTYHFSDDGMVVPD